MDRTRAPANTVATQNKQKPSVASDGKSRTRRKQSVAERQRKSQRWQYLRRIQPKVARALKPEVAKIGEPSWGCTVA